MSLTKKIDNFIWKIVTLKDQKAKKLFIDIRESRKLYEKIKLHRLETILVGFCERNSIEIPKKYKHIVYETHNKNSVKTLITINDAFKLARKFNGKINYIFLKGITFISEQSMYIRNMRDIDILVDENDLEEAVKIAHSLGFKFFNEKAYDKKYSLAGSGFYDIPLMKNANGVFLEIHYRIDSNKSGTKCKLSQEMLKNSQKKLIFNNEIMQTSNELNVLHLIFHSSIKGNFDVGASSIFDFFSVMKNEENINTDIILEHARMLNFQSFAESYLGLLDSDITTRSSHRINSHKSSSKILKELILMPISNKQVIDFIKLENFKEKLNFLRKKIFVNESVLVREFGHEKISVKDYINRWIRQIKYFYKIIFFSIINYKSLKKKAEKIKSLSN